MTATRQGRKRIEEALARMVPSVLVVYAAYTVSSHVLVGLGPDAPPLAQFSGVELGPLDAATLIYYVVACFLALSTAAAGYYAFTIGATHKAVVALSTLPLVSASLGRLSMGDVSMVALVGLLLLYLYPYRRRYVVEERRPEAASAGGSALHVALAASFYGLPPLLALGGSALVTAAMSLIIEARPEVPPPLPDIWGLFASTRLAFILVAVTTTAAVLWVLGELVESLLLFYTLTPRDASLRARRAVEEDLGMLESWSTWHQRIMVWSASTIMGVLTYPLVYGATWRLVGRAGASMPSWLLLAVDLAATILVWRLFHVYVRGIVVHRGVHRGAALVAVPVALLASYAALAVLGMAPVDPIYYALGLRPPSSRGDVLSNVWSDEAMRRSLEGMFKEFERVARVVVRLLWG